MEQPQLDQLLTHLADAGVEAIVVGMFAGIVQGVPLVTADLDLVHRRTDENVQRLVAVLAELDAVARSDPRRIRPNASHLIGPGHLLTRTRLGDLDCLGTIDGGRSYEDLLDRTVLIDFDGRTVRVVQLEELLAIKRRAGRPKDLAAVPYIEATIRELAR